MTPRDHILGRLYLVLLGLSVVPVLVGVQLVRLWTTDGPDLREDARRQVASEVELPALRGAIYDREGRTLVTNAATFDVAVDPTIPGYEAAASDFYTRLARLTGTRAARLRRLVDGRSSPRYAMLVRGLTQRQKAAVDSWDVPGVVLERRFGRRYPYGRTAAHVLGHVGSDEEGLAGVEVQYDDHLQGTPGLRAAERDRLGRLRASVEGREVEPQHGGHLVLTLDLVRQQLVEEELARGVEEADARWGAAIAMDPHTGEILALANVPTYDPARAGSFGNDARRNRAVADELEPGSVFKLVSAVAALEEGLIQMTDTVETGQGWAVFHGRTMRDSHGYGRISFADVIVKSSNVGTARTLQHIDPGAFYRYARAFGFGQPTLIDVPGETSGRLKHPRQWSGTSLTSMSIGYEVTATPLQVLTAYAALANGGRLVQPHLVRERRDVTGRTVWQAPTDSVRRIFDRETAEALTPAFERVVSDEGTARRARVEGLRIAGKTGTARKVKDGRYASVYRATFVGFFPVERPEVALIVVMDEPQNGYYGGTVSAPVFSRIAERWLSLTPTMVRPPTDTSAVNTAASPRPLLAEALPAPAALPEAAERVAAPDTSVQVLPDLVGLPAREATFRLARLGVAARVEGRGRIAAQTPAAGGPLPAEVVLRGEAERAP